MPCEDCRRAGRPEQRAVWRVASPGSNYFDTRPRWCRICARSHPGATAPPKSKPRPRCLGCTKSANYTDTTGGGAKWCVTCARTATIGEPIRVGRPAVKRRWDDAGFELRPEPAGLLREGRFFEPAPHKASKFPANVALAQALRHARGGYPDAERALREAGCVRVQKTHPEDFTAKAGGIKYYKDAPSTGRLGQARSLAGFKAVAGAVDAQTGRFIFCRAERDQSDSALRGMRQKTVEIFNLAASAKHEIARGEDRDADSQVVFAHGYRKARDGVFVEYVYKDKDPEKQGAIDKTLTELVEGMESAVASFIPKGIRDSYLEALDQHAPSRVGMFAGAITAGHHYHSQVHTDKDMFLTYLGVLSDTDDVENADDIVHLFVFPEYRVYVEMRSGDTLLFNPCEAHGCSEGLVESPWIFSCYLSTSTAVSQAGVRVGAEAKANTRTATGGEPIRVGRPAVKRQAVSEDANATDATECAICMSTPVDSVTTPCGHTFCGECLGYWLNQQESGMSCPQCRSGLRSFARKIAFTDTLPAAWCEPVVQDAIEIGTLVEANFGQYGAYYPGRITSVNSNGTYSIDYDDGDKEARVPRHCVRLRPLEAASRSG